MTDDDRGGSGRPLGDPSRRRFLAPWRWISPAPPEPPATAYLRPPGALAEALFLQACTRCEDCVGACPVGAIVGLGAEYGEPFAGTPIIRPRDKSCVLCADIPCVRVCETGALRSVVPQFRMGLARLHLGDCFAAQGRACDDCVRHCPLGAAALRLEGGVPRVDPLGCTGCGRCEEVCPAKPAAIVVERLPGLPPLPRV